MKSKKPLICDCGKLLREHNKSGLCSACYKKCRTELTKFKKRKNGNN
jgi:NMD protein affecting ribosome stability and mRNA decay